MTENQKSPDDTGNRALASIVFTDVVNYSERMSKDEYGTLVLVSKDLALMTDLTKKHQGRVIKSTGDGLMIYFDSAVKAVAWAIEFQSNRVNPTSEEQPEKQLQHRIGIHIGDVYFKSSDLMGDGVNIASRLEGLAKPGGICISQTVYDTVKNKLPLNAKFLGQQKLKNLDEKIPVYHVDVEEEKANLQKTATVKAKQTEPTRKMPGKPLIIGTAIVSIFFVVLFFYSKRSQWENPFTLGESQLNSIAVLSFHDMSPEKDQEYFCEGMAEEILNALAQVKDLQVTARSSSFMYKGNVNIPYVGEQLNVNTVLEGSVRKAGNNLRITAQLINVADGYHLWSKTYDRKLENVFVIQDEIAQAITKVLKVKLKGGSDAPLVNLHTENIEAYDQYLLGRYRWNQRRGPGKQSEVDLIAAIKHFKEAIVLDPDYALAYSGLADVYLVLPDYTPDINKVDVKAKAEDAIMKALALGPCLTEAHTSFGFLNESYYGDYIVAEKEYQRAIELNPRYAPAHYRYSYLLTHLGRLEESVAEARMALELEPFSLIYHVALGSMLTFARQYDSAIKNYQRAIELDSNNADAWFWLMITYICIEEFEDARKALTNWAEIVGVNKNRALLFVSLVEGHVRTGQPVTPPRILVNIVKLWRFTKPLYAYLGHKEKTIELFEKEGGSLRYMRYFPAYDFIRNERRFTDLIP